MCASNSTVGSCGWQALSTRTVKEACLRDRLVSAVEAENRSCFEACGPRNETSSCWVDCFFDTVLGPEARKSNTKPVGGMSLEKLQQSWENAFETEKQGGCPVVDMEPYDIAIAAQLGLSFTGPSEPVII